MKKEQRDYFLKDLAKSSAGLALKEYIEELIDKMTDISAITSYEELIGKQVTIKILKETLRNLNLLAEERPQKSSNQYV